MDRPKLNPPTNRGKHIKIANVIITDIEGNVFEYSSVKEAAAALQTSESYLRLCEQKYKKFRGAKIEFKREEGEWQMISERYTKEFCCGDISYREL